MVLVQLYGSLVSDDIPIIFADDILSPNRKTKPVEVFLSAASATQMQQYAAAGWCVRVAPNFKSSAGISLDRVPATAVGEVEAADCSLLSCEAPFLDADTGARICKWKPAVVKFNCAFYDVADAGSLASSLAALGYFVIGAHWRDDNSFAIRSLANINHISSFPALEWDRMN